MSETSEKSRNSLSLRVGNWFEAKGTGWGVVALPIFALIIALIAVARWIGL